jgi:hypothetical protein
VYAPGPAFGIDDTFLMKQDILHPISYIIEGVSCDGSFVKWMMLHSLITGMNRNELAWHKRQNQTIFNEHQSENNP